MTNTILNAKEDEEIVQFFEIKTVLSAVIHRKELLNFFRKCVDVSEYLEFTSYVLIFYFKFIVNYIKYTKNAYTPYPTSIA